MIAASSDALLRVVILAGSCLLWIPEMSAESTDELLVNACVRSSSDVRLFVVHSPSELGRAVRAAQPSGVLIARGVDRFSDAQVLELDEMRNQLVGAVTVILEISTHGRQRLDRLAPNLWDMCRPLEAGDASTTEAASRADQRDQGTVTAALNDIYRTEPSNLPSGARRAQAAIVSEWED